MSSLLFSPPPANKPADDDVISLGSREGAVEMLHKANERLASQNERILGGMRLLMREPFDKTVAPVLRGHAARMSYRKARAAILRMQTVWRWNLAMKLLKMHLRAQKTVASQWRCYVVMTRTAIGQVLLRSRRYARERDVGILAHRCASLEAELYKSLLDDSNRLLASASERLATMAARCKANELTAEQCRSAGFEPEECLQGGYSEEEVAFGFNWREELRPGDLLDARDCEGRWLDAAVVAASEEELDVEAPQQQQHEQSNFFPHAPPPFSKVKVHFRGWSDKWDVVYNRGDPALQPHLTKCEDWRATMQPGDLCEVRSNIRKKAHWQVHMVIAAEPDRVQVVEWHKVKKTKPLMEARGALWIDKASESLCKKGTHFKPADALKEQEAKNRPSEASTLTTTEGETGDHIITAGGETSPVSVTQAAEDDHSHDPQTAVVEEAAKQDN